MKLMRVWLLALAASIALFGSPVGAQNVTTFDFPGSTLDTYTTITGINDKGVMVGSENSTGVVRGFVLRPDGSLETVVAAGAIHTLLADINNRDVKVGAYNHHVNGRTRVEGMLIDHSGVTLFNPKGSIRTFARGINDHGEITGDYTDTNGVNHGFIRKSDGAITAFDIPDAIFMNASKINSRGQIVGGYLDGDYNAHGFIRDRSGAITLIDVPGAGNSYLEGINDHGDVVGWADTTGFVLTADGRYTFFNIGVADTFCSAINNRRTIVGGIDDDFTTHGLIIK